MEKLVKVVVFHADVPEDLEDCDYDVYSSPFTIKVDDCKETKWKIACNFNRKSD